MAKPLRLPPPIFMNVGGVQMPLYTIGMIAHKLDRDTLTVRRWERLGFIPKAMLREPPRGNQPGRRLYTMEEVEAIVTTAKECQVRSGFDLELTRFRELAFERVREVRDRYKTLFQRRDNAGASRGGDGTPDGGISQ